LFIYTYLIKVVLNNVTTILITFNYHSHLYLLQPGNRTTSGVEIEANKLINWKCHYFHWLWNLQIGLLRN